MRTRAALALMALPLAAAGLWGCVVAAIPLAAGGAVARTATDNKPGPETGQQTSIAPTFQASPIANSQASEPTETTAGSLAAAQAGIASPPRPSVQSPAMEEFIRYSADRAFSFAQGSEPLRTAVLQEPSALDGRRLECALDDPREPAVLIDLDPGDEKFSEGSPLPSSGAALSLKVLRSEGVKIAWISENSAANADIIRNALSRSGLDPQAEDTLLLMRYPDDRKQTRRKEFAEETCLIAIAGDRRSDFDELYDYLTNRDAALELEALINNGWFLIGDEPEPYSSRVHRAENPEAEKLTTASDESPIDQTATPNPEKDQEQE